MLETLKVSLVQTVLHWENPSANLEMLTETLEQIKSKPDLIVLPEMFSTGFTMQPERMAENEEGASLGWMKKMAESLNCVITGSIATQDKGHFFNRLFWVRPNGEVDRYDKRHLFSLAGEENHYKAGSKRLVVDLKGFKIMPLVCYDLRFPVWSRNDIGYDLAIYVANWPERRNYFWKQLLIARAIENQSFVIGVNRVGNDGNDISHSGDSVCLGPLGNEIALAPPSVSKVLDVEMSKKELLEVRNKFRFLNDRDKFQISI